MAKNLLVGMIEFANVPDFGGVNRGEYDEFEDALARAVALMNGISTSATDVRMFVAPEYYFSGHGATDRGATTIASLTRDDKHGLYKKLKSTSARYPNVLLIPGSIAYSKARGLSKRKYYNVCPIAAGGQIIHKYYKQSNDTFQSADDFKSKDYGATFEYKQLRFGIDICLDHGHKRLKNALGTATVDVHILVADGAAPSSTSIAAPAGTGVVVYCNMNGKGVNGVLTLSKNTFGNLKTTNAGVVARHDQPLAQGAEVAIYTGTAG